MIGLAIARRECEMKGDFMNFYVPIFLWIVMLALSACVNTAEKKVEQDIVAQGNVESPARAVKHGRVEMLESDKLTEEQKTKFINLFEQTENDLSKIRKEEGPLKAALFQTLSKGSYDPKEMSVYFYKMKKLEDQKMELMFSSLIRAGRILKENSHPEVSVELSDYYQSAFE